MGQGIQQAFIHRPVGPGWVERFAGCTVSLKAAALFFGVCQFLKRIGQFHSSGIQLKPQSDARVCGVTPGKGGLTGGPVGQKGWSRAAYGGFHPFQ